MKNIFILCILVISLFSKEILELENFKIREFSPTKGEKMEIPIKLHKNAKVTIDIVTEDNHLVKSLTSKDKLKKGVHKFIWDGKDERGVVVPDEAYSLVFHIVSNKKKYRVDSRDNSGGETEEKIKHKIYPNGKIEYFLSKPSRVLIRTGIKNGPMLKSLLNWKPKLSGKNIKHWNGYDNDNLINILKKEFSVLVTAYNLPKYSIITYGNKAINYEEYYKKRGWKINTMASNKKVFERGNRRISPHYYIPKILDKDPKVNISFKTKTKKMKNRIPVFKNGQRVKVVVKIPKEDLKYIEKTRYEVSFFIDNKFVSEEEQGYIPITWLWTPNGLQKGKHTMSVNISGFKGQVGVKSVEFTID